MSARKGTSCSSAKRENISFLIHSPTTRTNINTRTQMPIVSLAHGISLECTLEYEYLTRTPTGTVKRRGLFFTSQKKPKTFKLQWNNLDDYTAVSTIIGYMAKLEESERDGSLDEDSVEDGEINDDETSVDTLPSELSNIREYKNLIDETNVKE